MKTDREIKAEIAKLTKWRKRTQTLKIHLLILAMEEALSWVMNERSFPPTRYIELFTLVEKEGRKSKT